MRQAVSEIEAGLRVVINIGPSALLRLLAPGGRSTWDLWERPVIGGEAKHPSDAREKVDTLMGIDKQHATLMRVQAFREARLYADPFAVVRFLSDVEPTVHDLVGDLLTSAPPGLGPFDLAAGAYWTRGHLAIVPVPPSVHWDGRIRRIVETYLLPMARRSYWRRPRSSCDLAPLVLVEMVQTRPSYLGRLYGDWPPAVAALERCHEYAQFEDLPTDAEEALEDFIDACLANDTGRFEPPPRLTAYA